ncbi:hypothetical protein MRY87_06405 [bacterium]|nr:hypothetical protein [bacterium]
MRYLVFVLILMIGVLGGCQEQGDSPHKKAVEKASSVEKGTPVVSERSQEQEKEETPLTKQTKHSRKKGKEKGSKKLTAEDVKKETMEAVRTAKRFTEQTEAEYHAKLDKRFAQFVEKLDALRASAEKRTEAAKAKVSMEVRAIESKMEVTAEQLEKFNDGSGAQLKKLAQDFEEMLSDLDEVQKQ